MNIEQAAKAFLDMSKDWDRDALRKAYKELPEEVQRAYSKLKKASFFVPENVGLSREELSSSGKYKLVITAFSTGSGSWNYTQGSVYRIDSDEPIAVIQRNYSRFPYAFVEDHPNGHAYLVAGEDYQGQTVIELDTGRRRDLLPEEAKKGHGFCWSSYEYIPEMQALLVDGCFWACPYEYRFYDFSDPMNGWPQIGEDVHIDVDQRKPELLPDGMIKVFQTEYTDDDEDDEKKDLPPVAAFTVYRREGPRFVEVEVWVSEEEQKRRLQREENERQYEERLAKFRAEDPLYREFLEQLKSPTWASKFSYEAFGITYDGWCPHFTSREQRISKRIMSRQEGRDTVSLEWGMDTGPIKVNRYKAGEPEVVKFFPHSVEGMVAAFAWAKEMSGS